MDLSTISGIALAVILAAVVVLKAIAPKTKTDKDDKALSVLERILQFFGKKPVE